MFFLGWIFGFIYIFFWVGGSPRPVSYARKFVLLTLLFSYSFSWDVLPGMDLLRVLFFSFHWVGGSLGLFLILQIFFVNLNF